MAEKPTYEELEQRIALLEKESAQRERFEKINTALFKIADAVNTTFSLDDLFRAIHQALCPVIDTTNFFIALYDDEKDSISFPYIIDTVDNFYPDALEVSKTASLSAEVIRTRSPLLATRADAVARQRQSGLIIPECTPAAIWLGVPLKTKEHIVGIMAVQNYHDPSCYDQTDMNILVAAADQVAIVLERKQAESALRSSATQLQSVFRAAPVGIGVVVNRVIVQANERLCQMTGYAHAELVGQSSRMLYVDTASYDFVGSEKYRQITAGGTGTVETRWQRKDGVVIDVLLSSTPFDTADLLKGVTFSALDITERKRAEEERERLQAQLTQAQKMESVGRLAGGLAHDFNNMLGVILGHTELALDQLDPGQALFANLQEINKAATRSANLTGQLLAFARKQIVTPKVLSLNETVEGMLAMLRRLIGEDIDLSWLPGKALPPVRMDPSQIDQILANLCVNARDAIGDTGRIIIETANVVFDESYCATHEGTLPGQYVMLAASDDGCGMDPGMLPQIFEPFFTTKGVGKGTGLGLATVFGIVKQNNGFINVYSEPGQGTTFKIYLPYYTGSLKPLAVEEKIPLHNAGSEIILLVEDEPMILEMTETILKNQGYTVLTAATPSEAMHLAREYDGKIGLLITDVVMPEMNGRTLARKLLSHSADLKCLFMSGYTANVIAQHGVLDPGVHFIQKPFSINDLGNKVREVLDQVSR